MIFVIWLAYPMDPYTQVYGLSLVSNGGLSRFSVGAADSVFSPSAKLLALLHDNKRYHIEETQDKP